MPENRADAVQTRAIAEQVAETAIAKFAEKHPELRKDNVVAEVPAPLKWAATVAAGLLTLGTGSLCYWLVSSVSQMNVTLARMDQRMIGYIENQDRSSAAIEARVQVLESYHRGEAK